MKELYNNLLKIRFFIRGYEYYAIILIIFAILIGLIEAFNLSLLYPMLSEGFQINSNSIPLYSIFKQLASILPIGSPFVNLGIVFVLMTFISLGLQLIYWKIGFIFQTKITITAKKNIFSKIKKNDFSFFVDTGQGELTNLFIQSPNYINGTFLNIINLCADIVSSIAIILMLYVISPGGLLLVMIGGGIFYCILHYIGKNISEQLGKMQIQSGESENSVISEFVIGNKAITVANATSFWEKSYEKAINIYWNVYANYMFIQKIPVLAINSMFYISIGVIVLILYIFYSENFIALIPILGTFAAGSLKILPKFTAIGEYKLQLNTYFPHAKKVYELLTDDHYHTIKNGTKFFSGLNTGVSFDSVSFAYQQRLIIDNISFFIEKGKITALVGSSGSGKSTIVNLVLRLFDTQKGQISIDELNIKEYDIQSIREKIGYVSQDPFVYNASIRDNITFGNNFSEEEIVWACKQAHAHEFILKLSEGYNTIIGDRGIKLSGGEKQRLVIARAMIRKPEILILDEATSSLDNISESIVQKAIDEVANECTTLLIAHRLSTIEKANKIIVIEHGKIVETGNHKSLMERDGKYRRMYLSAVKK